MKTIIITLLIATFFSLKAYAFDSSLIEHREAIEGVEIANDDKLLTLSPGLTISEFGVSHDVAVNKSFDLNNGKAGSIDLKIMFNSSTDTDDKSEVIKQLSFGGGDSIFKIQYINSIDINSIGKFNLGAGADVSGWEYNIKLDTGEIINDDTVFSNYNLYAYYKVQDEWYIGIKATYFDVLSDNEENAIENEINGESTVNVRALLPFQAKDGSKLWLQADLIFPLANEDPIFTLGAVMNFNVL